MANFLEVNHITKYFLPPVSFRKMAKFGFKYRKLIRALEDISFQLKKGQILGVLGPNGSGKTTLLKIIATLILPNKGEVLVNGYSLGKDDDKIKSFIGLVTSAERSFYWRLTGRQNLEFFAAMYGLKKKEIKAKLGELFQLFEVDYQNQRFDAYSAGMKQKFGIIRALVHNPQLLLLDEPTQNLDYLSSRNLRNFIKEKLVKEKGKTVIFTTHHMDEAMDFCDLFLTLHQGRDIALGTLDELRKKTGNLRASLGEIYIQLTKDA